MLSYELQFFAKDGPGGEKTEPATQKKLDDARKEGQVAKSREVNMGLSLLAAFLVAKVAVGLLGNGFLNSFSMIYGQIPEAVKLYDGNIPFTMLYTLIRGVLFEMLKMMAPFLIIGFLVAFIADIIQVKWKPTFKPMQPKLSKFNPLKGMKKIFSTKSLVELFKSICKIAMIGWVAYQTLHDQIGALLLMYDMPLLQAIAYIGDTVIGLGVKISALYMVIAFADFLYQKWKFSEDMKMTKQEVKDEMKNAEGDPQIKGRIRQKMREASRRRMMEAVPEADVVITNPTHFAVAIKYDPDQYSAPVVTAKGEDYLAQKIKEAAREHGVEIVENKPLARMLYANVEIGEMVPPELYQAVAEVLAMVYQMQGKI